MEPLALVPRRHVGETVRGLEAELVDETDLQAPESLRAIRLPVSTVEQSRAELAGRSDLG
jgi:hypothetical protein